MQKWKEEVQLDPLYLLAHARLAEMEPGREYQVSPYTFLCESIPATKSFARRSVLRSCSSSSPSTARWRAS